jgi:hypothetical protein
MFSQEIAFDDEYDDLGGWDEPEYLPAEEDDSWEESDYEEWDDEEEGYFPDEEYYGYDERPQNLLGSWPRFLFVSTMVVCCLMAGVLSLLTAQDSFFATNSLNPSSGENEELAAVDQSEPPSSGGGGVTGLAADPEIALGDCQVSAGFPHTIRQWCGLITAYANKRGLPPDLIAALIMQESGGNPQAYSRSGAVGLMQVMPRDGLAAGFTCVNGPCFADRPSTSELTDPDYNISYGTKMLANLFGKHGSLREALRSYGPMDVGYSYADKVLGIYQRLGN